MKTTRVSVLMALAFFAFIAQGTASAAGTGQSPIDRAGGLIDKHDYKGAIKILNGVIEQDPHNAIALAMRGDAKDDDGDATGALEDYNAALEANPDYEYAYATRCGTQVELSHNGNAIADCTKALSLKPKDDAALRFRSAAYYMMGDYQLAADDAAAALQIDSSNPGNILATCRAQVGLERADGFKDCNAYVSYEPNDENGYFFRARTEMFAGKPADAKRDFHKALQLDNTYTAAHYWLATIALDQKAYNEAIGEADAFLSNYASDPDTLMLRAAAEQKLGQIDAARADATTAVRQYRINNDSDGESRAQSFLNGLSKP